MAEEASEVPHPIEGGETESAQDMGVEAGSVEKPGADEQPSEGRKRGREEGGDAAEAEEGENGASKMQKVVMSVEEERIEKLEEKKEGEEEPKEGEEEEGGGGGGDDGESNGGVSLGPKVFSTSVEMFDYLYKFLHFWAHNLDINKEPMNHNVDHMIRVIKCLMDPDRILEL